MISKVRYKIEQYFGLTKLHQGAGKAQFTTMAKQGWDNLCVPRGTYIPWGGAIAFNIKRVTLATRKQQVLAATYGEVCPDHGNRASAKQKMMEIWFILVTYVEKIGQYPFKN